MRNILFTILFGVLSVSCVVPAEAAPLTDQAEVIYKHYHPAVLQVRVISKETGEKAALGSGFQFLPEGLAATNYHVVSDAALYPNLYYMEVVQHDGETQRVSIVNLDPVHDLAILKLPQPLAKHLELGVSHFDKGTKIFSFGNPYDLGMTIVQGLYNGLMEHAMYRKVLFSGSLNPGMSGGPALGQDGKVLGVNVSTAGNQISFVVPVEYLKSLYQELSEGKVASGKWEDLIRKRIVKSQEDFLGRIVHLNHWHKRRIGQVSVPGEISDEFKCWGQSGDNDKYWMKYAYLTCSTEDDIFLSSTMYTGSFSFKYTWMKGRTYAPFRFYNLYQEFVGYDVFVFDNAAERDAKNFNCSSSTVNISGKGFQASTCLREYKKYKGVYDMDVKLSSVHSFEVGLTVDIVMMGVTQKQGSLFLKKFIDEIVW